MRGHSAQRVPGLARFPARVARQATLFRALQSCRGVRCKCRTPRRRVTRRRSHEARQPEGIELTPEPPRSPGSPWKNGLDVNSSADEHRREPQLGVFFQGFGQEVRDPLGRVERIPRHGFPSGSDGRVRPRARGAAQPEREMRPQPTKPKLLRMRSREVDERGDDLPVAAVQVSEINGEHDTPRALR